MTEQTAILEKDEARAPFPHFGGKSRVASVVWSRFGNPQNYVEPFAGSLAVLLSRPTPPQTETVNDIDGLITNFWRALQADPEGVARFADWPVSELDLHARHRWLMRSEEARAHIERMRSDPDAYDVKIAGWWVWGKCCWIGSGWCVTPEAKSIPYLGEGSQGGVLRREYHMPVKSPRLSKGGAGVQRHGLHLKQQIPELEPHPGGINRSGVTEEKNGLHGYLLSLSERLRRVRICCGDWTRVLGPTPTTKHGMTAVFLDPPYPLDERESVYSVESDVFAAVHEWAVKNGNNPLFRIALCGYESDRYPVPKGWETYRWKAAGGYGSQGKAETRGKVNARREVIYFSPACLRPQDAFDFDNEDTAQTA